MRDAVFAGSFYASDPDELKRQFSDITGLEQVDALGLIAPHAGYVYSGRTAFRTMCSVRIPDTVLILCPNHRGLGAPIAVSPDEQWRTPLGDACMDAELANGVAEFPQASWDRDAHRMEHSLEVQIPLLQLLKPDVRIVAISLGTGDTGLLDAFADHLAELIDPARHLVLASSDMSHFISAEQAREADMPVIQRIEALDAAGMLHAVLLGGVSMCGVYPSYVMLRIAAKLGARQAEVVEYTHSGVITGDHSDVVAYLGVRVW